MKIKNSPAVGILALLLLGCGGMAFTERVLMPGYAVKSAIKILLFCVLPLVYAGVSKSLELSPKRWLIPHKGGMLLPLFAGVGIYALILGAYFVCRNFYDFSGIAELLTQNAGVSRENFVWVALYISFGNSLLEEFFFRGFAFLALSRYLGKRTAYVVSALLFAGYHVAIMTGWFSFWLFLFAMLGLAVGGWIFDALDSKSETIYPSWMVHAFANFAINTVGFLLFGIIG